MRDLFITTIPSHFKGTSLCLSLKVHISTRSMQTGHIHKLISLASKTIVRPQNNLSISLISFYNSLFIPIPLNIIDTFEKKKAALTLYKTYLYLKTDPYYNIMLHKKLMNVCVARELTLTSKEKAFNLFITWYKTEALKYNIEVNEKTNFTVLYEIYCGITFGQTQSSVHTVTFLAESSLRSPEAQQASLLHTKQARCDLLVTYDTQQKKTFSLLDILIGRNKEYKGNLIFTKPDDFNATKDHKDQMLFELTKHTRNPSLSIDDRQILDEKIQLIKNLQGSNMTPAAQTITIQEHIISIINIIRKVNPTFNPNMIVFIPENPKPSQETSLLAEKIESYVPNDLGISTPNIQVEALIKKTLPIYLEHKKPDLSVMSPMERNYCLGIIKTYAPEYFATISQTYNES